MEFVNATTTGVLEWVTFLVTALNAYAHSSLLGSTNQMSTELIILTLNVLAEASATGNQVIANVLMATKEKLASELSALMIAVAMVDVHSLKTCTMVV